MGSLGQLRLPVPKAGPARPLLALSESLLTCHLQAAPDGAVSPRLCSHLRESWAMLEGESSVNRVCNADKECYCCAVRSGELAGVGLRQ